FKGARLVLLTDKIMEPVAHYWFYHDCAETVISTIIFYRDDRQVVSNKSKATLMGRVLRPDQGIKRLTEKEYALLSHLYHGETPKKIATKIGANVKSVYVTKLRVESKMGVRLNSLFI
ncbi:helix-turn-helix transcriptional regulator, partial [Brevibacterium metallidurans]|uniref:helix-turn-helix transcriptional regulator n=1 Tax=Brevibacterium metallidurans TaxID=1482676 RepID=UPI0030DA4EF4